MDSSMHAGSLSESQHPRNFSRASPYHLPLSVSILLKLKKQIIIDIMIKENTNDTHRECYSPEKKYDAVEEV
jgi:hypothetical protein